MSYAVIDNFCSDIDRVHASLLAAGFGTWRPNRGEVGTSIYDGMGFWGDHAKMVHALMRALGGIVVPNTLYFRSTNAETEQAYIHSDRESGAHTCVCYLTDHAENYGTAFYRHRRTGWTAMPSFDEMRKTGVFDELKADMVSRDPAKWEKLDFVRGRKNRAVVFDAPLFHSRIPEHGLGHEPENGRIVWVTHFHRITPSGELD